MTQQVNVYSLIAQTSLVLKNAMLKENKKDFPECITYAQSNMQGKISCAATMDFMQDIIRRYDR